MALPPLGDPAQVAARRSDAVTTDSAVRLVDLNDPMSALWWCRRSPWTSRSPYFLLDALNNAGDQDAVIEARPILKLAVDIVRVTGR
jgi:hypothetical protein